MDSIDNEALVRARLLVESKGLLDEMRNYLIKKYGEDFIEHINELTINEYVTYCELLKLTFKLMGGVTDENKCQSDNGTRAADQRAGNHGRGRIKALLQRVIFWR